MSIVLEAGALNSQDLAGLQATCTFTQHRVPSKWASIEFVGSIKSFGSLDPENSINLSGPVISDSPCLGFLREWECQIQ